MTLAQVEDTGWSPELWDSLNDLARPTVAAHTHVRALIPEGPEAPDAYVVEMPGFGAIEDALELEVRTAAEVQELEQRFRIHQKQLHDTALTGPLTNQQSHWTTGLQRLARTLTSSDGGCKCKCAGRA